MLLTTDVDAIELKQRPKKRMFDLLRTVLSKDQKGREKTLYFHFFSSPVEILEHPEKEGSVGAVKFEYNYLKGEPFNQYPVGTDTYETIETDIVFKAVGYKSIPIDGLPFDEKKGIVSNHEGRVKDLPGAYVCGWAKRGPSGIIGTNKWDAEEVVGKIKDDLDQGVIDMTISENVKEKISKLLLDRNVDYISFPSWEILDQVEIKRGKEKNKVREKFSMLDDVLSTLQQENKL